jgi:glycine dehydrogenase subunit 1
MRYIPHTEDDIARMLRTIGAPSVEALFEHIPPSLRLQRALAIPALDEASLLAHLGEIGEHSFPAVGGSAREGAKLSFLGAGLIPHHIPTAVDALLWRAEWYTSYTPYQPEVAQGTLQAIFEFQTLVAELFGPSARPGQPAAFISNASMYDGASAAAEAVLMARRLTGREAVLICGAVHPQYVQTISCYLSGLCAPGQSLLHQVALSQSGDGRVDLSALERALLELGPQLACVVVQSPNYLGVIEDLPALVARTQAASALVVAVCTEPLALGVLEPPGALGADIVCGEGMGLALPPTLGGPGVGLLAARAEYVRQMPGRLVGETVDLDGRRGYVLTLATREQHIRREKATSNICTNHGLIALAFTIHLSLLGRSGFVRLARLNLAKAEYAKQRLSALRGFRLLASGPTFNEFALRLRGAVKAMDIVERLSERGVLAGVPLSQPGLALKEIPDAEQVLLIAVSERHRREDIDALAVALDEVCP